VPGLAEASAGEVAERAREIIAKAIQRDIPGLEVLAEVTREQGATAKEVLFSRGTMKVYHYRPTASELYRVPVLLVMSLINKPYILDLAPGQSLIEYLVRQGFDVYMVDWGTPRREHSRLRLDDYVADLLPQCMAKIREHSGEPDVSVIGYCMGGMLATMYAALHPDGPLQNLVCFATPVNSDGMELHKKLVDSEGFDVDLLVDRLGNVPAELITASMQMLRPLQKAAGQMALLNRLEDPAFVKGHYRMAQWAADQVPFPGEAFRQLVKDFVRANKLVRNEFVLDGRKVELNRIRVPFLHVVAEHDHIVPYASSRDLVHRVGSADKREIMLKGGHISLVAGKNAVNRLWPQLEAWLGERSV